MRTLCWNCRGIGDPATVRELCELIRECAPSVVYIVETQLSKRRVEGLTTTLGFEGGFAVASSGRSGGLGIFWKDGLDLRVKNFSRYHIDVWVAEPGKEDWRLTCVYGEANRSLRQNTWDTMTRLRGELTLPWVCIGDFNEVLRREEQMGPNERDVAQMVGFHEAVDLCGLSDLGYIGLDLTFEKKIANDQYCRVGLARALATAEWSAMFPFALVRHLVAAKSDHSPVILMNDADSGNRRVGLGKIFRYEKMWEKRENFFPMFERLWKADGKCTSVSDMHVKLKKLSESLADWGSREFGHVRNELRTLKARLKELRAAVGRVGPNYEEKKIESRIVELNYREEVMWRQRSRIQWLAECDGNTKFFHQKATTRRRRNRISQLTRDDGTACIDEEEIGSMATEFYKNLYASEPTVGMEEVLVGNMP
ncbi:uncharacterized protein [Aegilops tauschii subsp. strangulata]|uniref:uncharacterized protein n=1 Tax=Aegilops tauschii subsp. strangulata TaxID=200361 RepID=UPI003CC85A28